MELARVNIGRGREELFSSQLPALLTELANRARIASITASSALEGVVVENQARAAAIIEGKVTMLRTCSEQEFAGYRAALDYLFSEDWRPLNRPLAAPTPGAIRTDEGARRPVQGERQPGRRPVTELLATRKNPHNPDYQETTLSCLQVILNEEWQHYRYAVRDLEAIEAKSGE